MSWTDQQVQALKQMWGRGFSASEIARCLGGSITRNAVIGKANRLKLSVGNATKVASPVPAIKKGGAVVPTMAKVAKKRAMLRPLPSVQTPGSPSLLPKAETVAARAIVQRDPVLTPSVDVLKKSEGVSVTKAGERHCRWPIGDPRSPDFHFCGCRSVEGLPYCADHARVAYQSLSRKVRNMSSED